MKTNTGVVKPFITKIKIYYNEPTFTHLVTKCTFSVLIHTFKNDTNLVITNHTSNFTKPISNV